MNLKGRERVFWIAVTLCMLFTICSYGAVGAEDDPLISLSYIKNVLMPYIDSKAASTSSTFEVVEMNSGATLKAGSGTELILRSGTGTVKLDSGAAGGFTDVTEGKDLVSNDAVKTNHHLLSPRDDGRKIYAKTKVYIMVKGEYELSSK
ncbi:MAG: hypothetical protein Q8882_06145 [Bacillota bacterium]|nr:hypothetical protein [Bacillota bacterium]